MGPHVSSWFYLWWRSRRNSCYRIEVKEGEHLTYVYKILILSLWFGRPSGSYESGPVREIKTNVASLVGFVSIAAWKKSQKPKTQGWAKAEAPHVQWRLAWGSRQSRFVHSGYVTWVPTTSERWADEGWGREEDHSELTTGRIHPCVGKPQHNQNARSCTLY